MELIIVRGLPGSGKSKIAKEYEKKGYVLVEANHYFIKNGKFEYEPRKINDAHNWCRRRVYELMNEGKNVVVANTFLKFWEFQNYLDYVRELGYGLEIIVAGEKGKTEFEIGVEKMAKMNKGFEEFDDEDLIYYMENGVRKLKKENQHKERT